MFIFLSLTDIVMRIVHMLIQCLLIRYCRGLALTVLYTVDTDVTYIFIACIHCFICTVLLNFMFTLIYVHSTLTVLLYTSTCTVHVRVPVTVTMQYCFSKHFTHRCLLSGYSTGSDFTALYEYKYSLTFYI